MYKNYYIIAGDCFGFNEFIELPKNYINDGYLLLKSSDGWGVRYDIRDKKHHYATIIRSITGLRMTTIYPKGFWNNNKKPKYVLHHDTGIVIEEYGSLSHTVIEINWSIFDMIEKMKQLMLEYPIAYGYELSHFSDYDIFF